MGINPSFLLLFTNASASPLLSRTHSRSKVKPQFRGPMDKKNTSSCNGEVKTLAVILDLDGTLLDTESAGDGILKEFLARYGKELKEEIENKKRKGLTQKESADFTVKDYELPLTPDQFIREITPMYRARWQQAKALPGADRLIKHLYKNQVPFALASNSLREHAEAKISYHQGWKECFSVIIGSDQVKSGKPSPDIFLEAACRMGVDAVSCLVIEDSLVGVKAAKVAKMKVLAVPPRREADCSLMADSTIHSLLEFQPELWGLPPFEDWVDNALPIEPIYLSSQYKASEFRDDGISRLPNQVSGVFFGWAEDNIHKTFKVVVAIGWDQSSFTTSRKIQICMINGNHEDASDQQLKMQLVGYIRGFTSKGTSNMEMEVVEEDKSIASAAMDLPMFIHSSIF